LSFYTIYREKRKKRKLTIVQSRAWKNTHWKEACIYNVHILCMI
jgi:hypothetical protein